MAIDRTGISSLQSGAGEITYSGNQGPKSPDQQLMAQADPQIVEMYKQYVFELKEMRPEATPMSFQQFIQQIIAESRIENADGGRAGYQGGQLVRPPGMTDEEWERYMFGIKGPRPLSSQSPYLSVHADGGRAGRPQTDRMPTEPRLMGNPPVMEEIENMREFRIANPNIEDIADYKGYYERLKRLEELKRLMQGVRSEPGESRMTPLSGMAYGGSANPTYTQKRKQNLAYGGIAGVDGRKRYGIGSYFQKAKDKFVDDIIPNEIKDNPILSSVVAGALLNQFGIPFTGTPGDRMGQNWLGELLGNVPGVQGGTVDTVLGGGGSGQSIMDIFRPETVSPNPVGGLDQLAKDIGITGTEGVYTGTGGGSGSEDKSSLLKTILTGATAIPGKIGEVASDITGAITGSNFANWLGTPSNIGGQQVNWKQPLAIGLGIGALDKLTRKDESLPAQPGIDIADISSRALTGSDPGLRFLPPASATTAYANGGRTGYATGERVEQDMIQAFSNYKNAGGKESFNDWFSGIYLPEAARARQAAEMEETTEKIASIPMTTDYYEGTGGIGDFPMPSDTYNLEQILSGKPLRRMAARGGRIGYDNGGSASDRYEAKIKELMDKGLSRGLAEALVISELSPEAYTIIPEDKAQGGRIGYRSGSGPYQNYLQDLNDGLISTDTTFNEWLDNNAPDPDHDLIYAQGGRVAAQEGGLMDLGGMEKDYRNEGGFVPIGGQERADDVPARLSKNEFVFTADAVRSAGGGDIDKGAEVMENVMEHLEQGGQISQESQGLEGARNMFATAQRLEGVL